MTYDEAFDARGRARAPYRPVLAALDRMDLAAAQADLDAANPIRHGVGPDPHRMALDLVPRVLAAPEWSALCRGLAQRARALDAFVADVHGPRSAFAAGVVPERVLAGCPWYEPDLAGVAPPPVRVGLYGPDLVRGADGRFGVLEDNARTPTLLAIGLVARPLLLARLGLDARPRDLVPAFRETLMWALRAAAPWTDEPVAAVLYEGPGNAAHWEVRELARLAGLPLLAPADCRVGGDGRVVGPKGRAIDVFWRRSSEERLRRDDGGRTDLGELLTAPLRAGRVAVVNAFGAGVADDKRLFPYVEDLVRFFLGEEPELRSVPSWDLGDPAALAAVLDRLDEVVVKPSTGSGGHGVVLGPRASRRALRAVREAVLDRPAAWLAQELVELSTHPTVVGGELQPRHCDLRPFVFCAGGDVRVLPAPVSRFARDPGSFAVNLSQGGGARDVWIM